MRRALAADWLRISRYWLTWVLVALWVVILAMQVNGKLNHLEQLEAELAELTTAGERTPSQQMTLEGHQFEASALRDELRYPAFIGSTVLLSTDWGWFLLILFTAVMGGEDFTRSTLRSILSRGIGRGRYLLARCLALWLAVGVCILVLTSLAAAGGIYVHARVTEEPISLNGLDEALFASVRGWLACFPFVVATLFWAVLARNAGTAMGVGIGLHFVEFLNGMVLPMIALATAGASNSQVPLLWRWQLNVFSVTLGYNIDVFLNWGSPFLRALYASEAESKAIFFRTMDLGRETLLPTTPWRSVAFLVGYSALFLGWAVWIMRRRDVTYGA